VLPELPGWKTREEILLEDEGGDPAGRDDEGKRREILA
jgi:hypothetical protein